MEGIKSFQELKVWQKGRQIRHRIYQITSKFPASERYNLVHQMRRAAVSMTSNIAEGFGRFSYKENKRSCLVSRGEAFELQDHTICCLDEGLIGRATFDELDQELRTFMRLLNGYVKSIGTSRSKKSVGHQPSSNLR